jgi:adenosine deaminase
MLRAMSRASVRGKTKPVRAVQRGDGAGVPRGRFAELHLHLGGAVLPNILHAYLRRVKHPLLNRYPTVERLEKFFARPRRTLDEYVRMHKLVEHVQRLDSIPYFVQRLVRGAVLFDNLAYMELRHTPWFRTDNGLDERARLAQMEEVVEAVSMAATAATRAYPLVFKQVLCMHSTLSPAVNRRIVELAADRRGEVVAVDLAGPDRLYDGVLSEVGPLFTLAKKRGLRTTAHLFETATGISGVGLKRREKVLPLLDRVGHGIQIPLQRPGLLKGMARRGQCLEVCPTSYLKTGTLKRTEELREVFSRCFDAGVDIAICTDNSGMHGVRLPHEYESLLVNEVLSFAEMARCQRAAFTHAFGWTGEPPKL